MCTKKSSDKTKSSYETFSNNLLKEQNECDDLKEATTTEKRAKEKTWKINRSYLGHFSCEEAIETIIKSHMNSEEKANV